MTEENKEIVEEVIDNENQSIEEAIGETIDESKFDSAGDDSVYKVDLDNPRTTPKNEEVEKEEPVEQDETEVVKEDPEVVEEQPIMEEVEEQDVQTAQDIVEEVYTKPKANWICGRCGWTTNEGDRATLHMWACGQFSLFRNLKG